LFCFYSLKIAGIEMPFIDQPHLDIFSDLIFVIDDCYYFNVHQAFMCTRTEYFSALIRNHFNEMIPNPTEENNQKSTMILKHIRKELFLPLLYYIYSDECEVNIILKILNQMKISFFRCRFRMIVLMIYLSLPMNFFYQV
jgi:hypothetical protein